VAWWNIFRRTERRDAGGFYSLPPWPAFGEPYGGDVEAVPAAASCINLISTLIASLPATIMQNGAEAPSTTPAVRITDRPSEHMSWPTTINSYVRDLLKFGNAIAWVIRDGRGAPTGLVYVPWSWLAPRIVSSSEGRKLAFDVQSKSMQAELLGLPPRLLSDDVMHSKLASSDGVLGSGILQRCPAAVREGAEISRQTLATFKNQLRPSAVLTAPNFLTPDQRRRKDEWVSDFAGSLNSGKVPLLEGGFKLEPMAISSTDAEFTAHRRLATIQIAAALGVPSELIQQSESRAPTDLSTFITTLAQVALVPVIREIECAFQFSVLGTGSDLSLVIEADGLQRGNYQTAVSGLTALVQSGVISANEAREQFGFEPRPDGNELRPNGAPPSWPADKAGLKTVSPRPGPTGDGNLPMPNTNEGQGSGKSNGAAHP
jgi:HK97 family phage portal protein